MNLKSMRTFFIGFAVGAVMFASTTSYAATAYEKISNAYINSSIKIKVDGQNVSLKNKPINYKNTNYLPVAEVAKALDATTTWDNGTQTINITSSTVKEVTNVDENENVDPYSEITETTTAGDLHPTLTYKGATYLQLAAGRDKFQLPNTLSYNSNTMTLTVYADYTENSAVVATYTVSKTVDSNADGFVYKAGSVYLKESVFQEIKERLSK